MAPFFCWSTPTLQHSNTLTSHYLNGLMPYELFISLRYLKAKRKQAFISLISLISIGGVTVGVAALIIVLAVMTGFRNDVRDKILKTMAHIIVQQPRRPIERYDTLLTHFQNIPHIESLSPYVDQHLLLSSEHNVSGVRLFGIDPQREAALEYLDENLVEGDVTMLTGKYHNLDSPSGPKRDGIIIGLELARILGVFTGDDLTLVLPMGHVLPTGPVPKLKKVRIVGLFSSGFYEYDAGLAYISLTSAQRFLNMEERISGIEIRLDDLNQTRRTMEHIKERLGPGFQIQDWADMNQSLFSAINLEKLAMSLILALIVLVAAFNIISTLVMMVIEKQSDIAILKSMGATSQSIMRIFMVEGSIIGLIGTSIGTIVGMTVCWAADTYKLFSLPGGLYHLDHLPFTMTIPDVMFVVAASVGICFLSTIYPARQASRLDPVVVFRHE